MDPRLMIGPSGPQLGGIGRSLLQPQQQAKKPDQTFANLLQGSIENSGTKEIRISAHAEKRLAERGITLSPELKNSLNNAMDALSNKGASDSLVVTNEGAFLVNVPSRTLVTAMGKDEMRDGIVTKIDSVSMKYS